MKKRNKIIFAVVLLLILISTTIVPTVADQAGELPFQTYTWRGELFTAYNAPTGISREENTYTLIIDASAVANTQDQTTHQLQINQIRPDENDPEIIWEDHYQITYGPTQIQITNLSDDSIILNVNPGSVPFGTIYAFPFETLSAWPEVRYTINWSLEIINNSQYTNANNYFNNGYEEGYTEELEIEAYNRGYSRGYNKGSQDASDALNAGTTLITTTIETPINTFIRILNFEILGINIFGFISACFTLMLVATILKKVIK